MKLEFVSTVDTATVDALARAVDPTFSAMATMTEKVVELAIRQNYVYAAWDGIVAVVAILIVITGCAVMFLDRKDRDWDFGASLIGCAMIIIGTIVFSVEACYIAARLINPEYMAIKDAITMIRGAAR